jgi:hypothetical protein
MTETFPLRAPGTAAVVAHGKAIPSAEDFVLPPGSSRPHLHIGEGDAASTNPDEMVAARRAIKVPSLEPLRFLIPARRPKIPWIWRGPLA